MMRSWVELLFGFSLVRWLIAAAMFVRGTLQLLLGIRHRAFNDFCWIVRVAKVGPWQGLAQSVIDRQVETALRTGRNPFVNAFLDSSLSRRCALTYSLAGPGPNDLFRDLIVLKAATSDEKGVILLKYARTFAAVVALLDFERLLERYTFVLEPCWAGYCDPALLMYVSPENPVVVQCFTEEDHSFIAGIGFPLLPVRLGPADWVSARIFKEIDPQPKIYDLVMVANWGAHKRHAELFRALKRIDDRDMRVLLIGFPWAGRTSADIRRDADRTGNRRVQIEILEQLPQSAVADYLSRCKVFVFLTKKEGDNKALVEAMFADVPAIVYDRSIGGAVNRINPATGILCSDRDLADGIRYMMEHWRQFSARAWALENTGSAIATGVLDEALRRASTTTGGRYSRAIAEKVNSPNLAYQNPASRREFDADYEFITSCLRTRPVS